MSVRHFLSFPYCFELVYSTRRGASALKASPIRKDLRHALSGGEGARAALLSTLVPLGIVFVAWSLAKQILIFAGAAVADEAHDRDHLVACLPRLRIE